MKTQLKIHFQMSETCVKIQAKPVNQTNLVEVNRKVTQTENRKFRAQEQFGSCVGK